MADLFVSYARSDKPRVAPLVAALEAQGWSVWWDPEIAPGQEFDRLIADELQKARAVVAVWTPASVASRWVRGEARVGADRGVLAPVRFEGVDLPIDLRAIHTTDLDGWSDDAKDPAFREVVRAIRALLGEGVTSEKGGRSAPNAKLSICVLPFANISGDPEQEYFSDGVSEDIITDLSKVSALSVVARNTAFTFKNKSLAIPEIARRLGVSHVLEGSVRKAGNRVRITAQLIDGAAGDHLWAERWDRDLTDIFALQDEISQAIVAALKVRLLPEEKKAIEERGTENLEAHKLYLMARRYFIGSAISRNELVIRLCRRAVQLDSAYAQPWALMATALSFRAALSAAADDESLAAAETAIRLDPTLAEAHAAKGRSLASRGDYDEAEEEIEIALRLDPQSVESNMGAGTLAMLTRQFERAARHFETAGNGDESDLRGYQMALQCLQATGDSAGESRVAKALLERAEKLIAAEPGDGTAYAAGANALATMGEAERARAWVEHAILLEPEDMRMHYNLACAMVRIGDFGKTLDLLAIVLKETGEPMLRWAERDNDLDPLREMDRFNALLDKARKRLAAAGP
ncbi:MAG TPA: TIR domain-containing protein [Caulobacteraceae bacterium]|jgi:adenylate cyclase